MKLSYVNDPHVRFVRIPELVVPDKPLGRHVVHDERSHDFPAETASALKSVVHKAVGLPLNQLQVGKCTCDAECGALNAEPDYKGGHVYTDADADQLYELETQAEGYPWTPANPSVNDIGGSGLEASRAAKKLGWLKSYRHAFGLEAALRALVLRPVSFGVPWYEGFDQPDAEGVVRIGGKIRGGHQFVGLRLTVEHELIGFAQSWGDGYGVPDPEMGLPNGGAFYMEFSTLGELLAEQGDAITLYPL